MIEHLPNAPAGPYSTDITQFYGINPNGLWRLYVVDDEENGSTGEISGSWCLVIHP